MRRNAKPPIEVVEILSNYQHKNNLTEEEMNKLVGKWYPNPALSPTDKRVKNYEQVDAYQLMEPFLDNPLFVETLRTMDVGNGCGHQCDTCFIDAVLPNALFSYKSLERLFSDDRFINMLQPNSFRFGSAGDIMDHPDAVKIIKMVLEKTQVLQEKNGKHTLKIFTNYRKIHEKKLLDLIHIANSYQGRLHIVISLPNNIVDTVNLQFKLFVEENSELFHLNTSKMYHPQREINKAIVQYPDVLTGTDRFQEICEYMRKYAFERTFENSSFFKTPKTLEESDDFVKRHLDFLPEYVRQEGGTEKYLLHIQKIYDKDRDRENLFPGKIEHPYVSTQDVRMDVTVYTYGRIINDDLLEKRDQVFSGGKANSMIREVDFEDRGFCKTFFNPDGHWLQVYASGIESHTSRCYTLLTPENSEMLSYVPFHSDFSLPPYWLGGTVKKGRNHEDTEKARKKYSEIKRKMNIIF